MTVIPNEFGHGVNQKNLVLEIKLKYIHQQKRLLAYMAQALRIFVFAIQKLK